jgi:hypothetical protein
MFFEANVHQFRILLAHPIPTIARDQSGSASIAVSIEDRITQFRWAVEDLKVVSDSLERRIRRWPNL